MDMDDMDITGLGFYVKKNKRAKRGEPTLSFFFPLSLLACLLAFKIGEGEEEVDFRR